MLWSKVNLNRKVLKKAVERQVKFPQANLSGYVFRYSIATFFSLLSFFVVFLLGLNAPPLFLMIFLLSSLFTNILAGSVASLIVLTAGIVTTTVFIYPDLFDPILGAELGLYIAIGILFGNILDFAKKINLIREFNKREKHYRFAIQRLQAENTKAQKEIKIRDEFLSIASHELKTPLTSTLLKLQIALNNIKNVSLADFSVQKLLEMLESAEQQTQRLGRMINDLLNVSIIRTGRLDLVFEETDLTEVVRNVVKSFSEKVEKEGYKLNLKAEGKIKAVIDKTRINQVVTNLVSNALKYGDGKPIEVRVSKDNSVGKITVEDHGIGVPPKQQDKIFSLFERAHGNSYKGLGIGLYISNQIIKAHKGKIKVDSKPGRGSAFTVEIPLENQTL